MVQIILKIILILSLFGSFSLATNTVTKIKSSKKNLNKSVATQKQMSQQIDKIAKDIEEAQNDNLE